MSGTFRVVLLLRYSRNSKEINHEAGTSLNKRLIIMDDFHISLTTENLLFSLYSIPNMVLPLFGGVFADRIGIRLCLIIFISIITFG